MRVRVLVCDREPLVRAGLRAVLSADPALEVVGEFADPRSAARAIGSLAPGVIVADTASLSSPAGPASGELVDASLAHAVPVLVLAEHDCAEGANAALRAGARGYLLRGDPPEQITYGIRQVAAGHAMLSPTVTGRLVAEVRRRSVTRHVPHADPRTLLTAREIEVLRLLAGGTTVAEIAARLFVAEVTVRSHIHHMLRKLGLDRTFQAVALAHETGLLDPESAAS